VIAVNNLFMAVEKFLMLMTDFGNLRLPSLYKSNHTPSSSTFPPDVKLLLPFVVDPVNPYNNLAWIQHDAQKKTDIITRFERHAKASLAKLRAFQNGNDDLAGYSFQNVAQIFDYTIFDKTVSAFESVEKVTSKFIEKREASRSSNAGRTQSNIELDDGEQFMFDLLESGANLYALWKQS